MVHNIIHKNNHIQTFCSCSGPAELQQQQHDVDDDDTHSYT